MYPIYSPEMVQARIEQLHRDARVASRRPRVPRMSRSPASGGRLAWGLRIVSAGFRLLAGVVDGR